MTEINFKTTENKKNNGIGLSEKTYVELKHKIITLQIAPGSVINEKELCQELHVSRTPFREALGKLVHDRLVDYIPRKGAFVPEITFHDIRNVYGLRELMEPFAARLATFNIEKETIERFKVKMDSLDPNNLTVEQFQEFDTEFHFMIINHCDNSHLMWLLIDNLYNHIARIRNAYPTMYMLRLQAIIDEHHEILEAIASRSPDAVESAMRKHLVTAMYRMINIRL